MEDEDKKKIYGKGYGDGLKDAWKTIIRLTTRGHSVHEIRMISKGIVTSIPNRVTEKVADVDPSTLLPKEEPLIRYDMTRPLQEGRSHIVKERRPDRSFLIFQELVDRGAPGLCVTRIHPDEVRETYGMENVRFVWLTRSEKGTTVLGALGAEEEFVSPTSLAGLATILIRFMEEGGKAILLEGIEYLVTQNSFSPVLKFLMNVKERALLKNVTFLLSVDPSTMDIKEYQQISREIGREV
ncbi:MAG: DUF835 domain-containing protein [Thermoplasmata archaeon]